MKVLAQNKKARFSYFIEESFEAGLVLTGTEVKSIRQGKANLKESYAQIHNGEIFLHGCHISPYEQGNIHNQDPLRVRKLLLHRREIDRLAGKVKEKGLTLVPLQLYLKDGRVKLELGLARGKKLHDKRETEARRDADRRMRRAMLES